MTAKCLNCGWTGAKSSTKARVPGVAGTGRKCPECNKSSDLHTKHD